MNEIIELAGNVWFVGTRPGIKIVYPFVTFGVKDVPLLKVTIS